ncbi:MAG: hypothetical protein ACTSXK_06470 [Promethearchaeota archaeon]
MKILKFLYSIYGVVFMVFIYTLIWMNKLGEIYIEPPLSPETWLKGHFWIEFSFLKQNFIFAEPSSTFFVYFLGIIAIFYGIRIIRKSGKEKSLNWWGIALCLWGFGAFFAGTSYQALSYELKCVNHENCLWTTWLEILYLLFSVASVNSMMFAQSFSCAMDMKRFFMQLYGLLNSIIYLIILIVGIAIPVRFMISFEMMVLFLIPGFIFFMIQNIRRNSSEKNKMDIIFIRIWLILAIVMITYFGYLFLGISDMLWDLGIWFTANDILHIGLIIWMIYIGNNITRYVKDLKFN